MELHICFSCMREKQESGPCPYCGFDGSTYQPAAHHLRPGTILAGKYILGRVMGEGGFGITYVGWDLNLRVKVAVKEYYPNGCVARDGSTSRSVTMLTGRLGEFFQRGLEKFVDEAQRLAKFWDMPGIVSVKDYFQENKTGYIVMEFVEGQTLKALLKQRPDNRLPVEEVFTMMRPVLKALEEVHKTGLIHRDISPDNLMVTPEGQVKLIDFGAARDFLAEEEKSRSVLLKPGYSPTEQYQSRGNQGPWTDVYSMCATIYRAITGQVPEEALDRLGKDPLKPPSQLQVSIDPQRERALMDGMAIFPSKRIQSMEELEKLAYGQAVRKSRRKLPLFGAGAAVLAAALIFLLLPGEKADSRSAGESEKGQSASPEESEEVYQGEAVVWADSNMEWFVRAGLGRPQGDIYREELEKIRVLRIVATGVELYENEDEDQGKLIATDYAEVEEEAAIVSLEDLQYFPNLITLQIEQQRVADISPVANLVSLENLNLDGNQISDISPLAGLSSLKEISFNLNAIADISPLAGLTSLTSVNLYANDIADITALSGLTSMKNLNVGSNYLQDISSLSGMTSLEILDLSFNEFTDITILSGLTSLRQLNLAETSIESLAPIANLTELELLDLMGAGITDVSSLAQLKQLLVLTLADNTITDLTPLSQLYNLELLVLDEGMEEQAACLEDIEGLEIIWF
ncbi:MAG TPA: leucine-rich repeat domain-containing protein [Candidatus Egerieimonas intestinavium]|uniref:Leucine-rich repeat domain-containing protein n=1 Tax=Candidatus Egerieimonas intestinavium TaxID=2840777 RepID=A0A9D1EL50_9FIRM|nr:leucine-rich repeat domain-containing protein [Candidatus Egerieimonas intestinavium]